MPKPIRYVSSQVTRRRNDHATNSKVDFFFTKTTRWQTEVGLLRKIALSCHLTEELKWGVPCYTLDGSNIVLIHTFKEYCAYLFFKGAIMKDPKGILIQQTANVQSARQIRFTTAAEIHKLGPVLKSCIKEAIKIEKAGLKVEMKKTREFTMPQEFQRKLDEKPALKKAFAALTPGRQRGYLLHFSSPKQAATRSARVEKAIKDIMDGKGLND